jgi:hypothetical protein
MSENGLQPLVISTVDDLKMEVDEHSSTRVNIRKSMDESQTKGNGSPLIHEDSTSNAKKVMESIDIDNESENKDAVPSMESTKKEAKIGFGK